MILALYVVVTSIAVTLYRESDWIVTTWMALPSTNPPDVFWIALRASEHFSEEAVETASVPGILVSQSKSNKNAINYAGDV